jgi:hypothetical protein
MIAAALCQRPASSAVVGRLRATGRTWGLVARVIVQSDYPLATFGSQSYSQSYLDVMGKREIAKYTDNPGWSGDMQRVTINHVYGHTPQPGP